MDIKAEFWLPYGTSKQFIFKELYPSGRSKSTANVMQLKVLGHIIFGNNSYFSFADEGMIEDYDIMFQDFNKRDKEGRK